MVDPAARYNELIDEEEANLRRRAKDYEPQLPVYSRKDKELTREEEAQDYRITKQTPNGYAMRLKEGKAKFGTKKAVIDILDWAVRNERG